MSRGNDCLVIDDCSAAIVAKKVDVDNPRPRVFYCSHSSDDSFVVHWAPWLLGLLLTNKIRWDSEHWWLLRNFLIILLFFWWWCLAVPVSIVRRQTGLIHDFRTDSPMTLAAFVHLIFRPADALADCLDLCLVDRLDCCHFLRIPRACDFHDALDTFSPFAI